VFDSSCSDSVQRDDEDSVGVEEFSALRHLGYKWVDPRVKLPLPRFSKSATIVDFRKKYDILADTVDDCIISVERARSGDSVCHGREGHSHDFFYMYSDEMPLTKGPTTRAMARRIQEEWASNAHTRPKMNFTWAKEDVKT